MYYFIHKLEMERGTGMGYRKYDSSRSLNWKRHSLRLPRHTYTWGAYFITIHAKQDTNFWETPALYDILKQTWETLPERFPGITLDEFVIMPDHVHFIIWLDDNVEKPVALGDVMKAYKSLTAVVWLRYIKSNGLECPGKFWQADYFERVIRDNRELEQTRQYIRDNPIKLRTSQSEMSEPEKR